MRRIWILGETEKGRIRKVSYELLGWAASLGERSALEITVVLPGEAENVAELGFYGADRILTLESPCFSSVMVRTWCRILSFLLEQEARPDVFLAAATTTGRTVLPYLAARHRLGLTADCTVLDFDIESGVLRQTRPAAGGNILATIESGESRPQMATVRPNTMALPPRDQSRAFSLVPVSVPATLAKPDWEVEAFSSFTASEEDIQEADRIVAGGRGLKKREHFDLLERVAQLLAGRVGASREAVDKGWCPYHLQVGLSGKTVSPRLYLAAGISGAIQHLAGMQTAEHIIAVNEDPDAQIFNVCDIGIVGDLFQFLPVLIEKLEARAGSEDAHE